MTPPSRRRRSLKAKVAVLIATSVVGCALIELTARALSAAPLEWREHPSRLLRYDAECGWALRPLADDFTVDKPVHVNADGFRDRDFPLERSPGSQRIVCVGDSYTYGWGVNVEDSFPKQLERVLASGTEVLNLGVFGYNADQALASLKATGLKYHPDLVVYSFYWDDLLPVRPDLMKPEAFAASRDRDDFSLRRFLRSSRALFLAVERARAIGAAVAPPRTRFHECYRAILAGDDRSIRDLWEHESVAICEMRDAAASVGARFAVVVWPLEAQVLTDVPNCHLEASVTRACEEAGVPSVSLLEPLRAVRRDGGEPYLPYEQHPTPDGYRRSVAKMRERFVAEGLAR